MLAEVEAKQQRHDMSRRNDDSLAEVLKENPFKPDLIRKWKRNLQSFLVGKYRLSDLNFALDSDMTSIRKYQEKNKTNERKRLHLELLPQPFQGNPKAPIWLLMLNPSYSSIDRYDHLGLCPSCDKNLATMKMNLKHDVFDYGKSKINALQKRQSLLLQQLRLKKDCQFSILNDAFNTLQHTQEWQGDGGYRWWQKILFGTNKKKRFLLPECGVQADSKLIGQKLFVLECCPYHSINFDSGIFEFSGEYSKFWAGLISWAINTNKKFIIRSQSVDTLLDKFGLTISTDRRVDFSSQRNVALTMDNLDKNEPVLTQIRRILKRRMSCSRIYRSRSAGADVG